MVKTFFKLFLFFSFTLFISSCVVDSYSDMMQARDEYNECLKSFNNNKDNCNHLKYKYNYTAQDYVNEAEDFWDHFDVERSKNNSRKHTITFKSNPFKSDPLRIFKKPGKDFLPNEIKEP